ncbi:peptidylprolyl isomerase [Sulfuriferula thiophila]|uniref:peptidylprolyl isomerase n=1 Tax=Sulfuriferula thiophila TaxID=1781211 RepID=UPI000F6057ED|nr:peptidyl-prolyl cis-trans isomerase [Sulfuriferula thiophila]
MQLKKIAIATVCAFGLTALTGCNAAEENKTAVTKAAAAPAPAASTSKALAVVNGVAIPQAQFDILKQDRAAQGQPMNDQTTAALRDSLINAEILAQEATKKGLDKDATIQSRLNLAKTQMLAQAYIADYVKSHPVTEEAMKAEYERVKGMMGTKEYEVRHILVDNEAEAKDIIAQLGKKAKFEDLAKKKSKDSSAANGGQLGWVAPGNLVKEFAEAMVSLKKGEYTKTPVHSKFGWHVIRVDEIRDLKLPPYDQIKDQLRADMDQQMVKKLVTDLRASAKVE